MCLKREMEDILTPRRFSSAAAKRIEKEETWKLNVEKSKWKVKYQIDIIEFENKK